MSLVSRGVRNTFRNSIRTISIVLILGLSIGLALTMLIARQAVQTKIDSVKSSIGNIITVTPAGSRGFAGGGEPLTNAQVSQVQTLPHVTKVTSTLTDQLSSSDTSLQSAIAAGSLGQRRNRIETNGEFSQGGGGNFTPPIIALGTSDPSNLQAIGGGTVSVSSGKIFDPNVDQAVAVIGNGLASKNNLQVGSSFTAYNTTFTVVGIFDAGNRFGNSAIIMPLSTEQRLSGQTNAITSLVVQVDSIDNLSTTVSSIQNALGSSADVVSQQDTSNQAIAPLENIKKISTLSLIGAVIAGAVIILLTMLMIVRERRREIGILKAIGASNIVVSMQFIIEAITFSSLALVVGLGIGVLGANPVTNALVSANTNNSNGSNGPSMGGGGQVFRGIVGQNALRNIHAAVSWQILFYGIAAMLIIAILGSAVPSWLIAKVRPAEVMRSE